MQWLRSHPYIASLVGAAVLILLGAFIVWQSATVQPEDSQTITWKGVGARLWDQTPLTPSDQGENRENIYSEVRSGPPFYYSPASAQPPSANAEASGSDLEALLTNLVRPASQSGTTQTGGTSLDPYSFIPGGLISISSPAKERTPAQKELYDYGNEAGSHIQSFENTHRNAPQTLKDQFEDREDQAKNAGLRALADGLVGVGRALEKMEDVPAGVAAAHAKVATSYQEIGDKLSRVPDAQREQEIIDAMLAYNTAVEVYVKNYIALATLFSAYGVSFRPEDPGSVFTFTQGSF